VVLGTLDHAAADQPLRNIALRILPNNPTSLCLFLVLNLAIRVAPAMLSRIPFLTSLRDPQDADASLTVFCFVGRMGSPPPTGNMELSLRRPSNFGQLARRRSSSVNEVFVRP
jgi:hypothetical protein